jgi:anti-sigma B factor antagonist
MEITERRIEDMDVLVLNGRLDAASAKELKNRVNHLVLENRVKLIVDMENVGFIDSSGLGSLVSSLRAVNEREGDVKVVGLQKQVRSIFELTRLHRIFGIFDDVEAATKSF